MNASNSGVGSSTVQGETDAKLPEGDKDGLAAEAASSLLSLSLSSYQEGPVSIPIA